MRISEILDVCQIRSVADYSAWLTRSVSYNREGSGRASWPSPEQVLQRRSGDCKDYASLNSAALKVLGYEPMILAVEGRSYGHAICVFRFNGSFAYFNNEILVVTPAQSLKEFAAFLYRDHRFTRLSKLHPAARRAQVLAVA